MDLESFDVPELIEALAERFQDHDISPREARHITVEMLTAAFAELGEFEDATRVVYVPPFLWKH